MNQIKSNQSQEKTYTTWVWLLWKSYEVNSILFINNTLFWFRLNILLNESSRLTFWIRFGISNYHNTLFWFRLNILLNESSRLTFWIRFGISNYHPYSLFRSTYQCHQNKDNRNYILQNCQWMLDLANPHSIISIHINRYLAMSTNMNHHHPIFLPYLTVSDITNHTILFIDSFYYQSFNHS